MRPRYALVVGDGSGVANGVRGGVTEASHLGDERTALTGFLQRQRDLVAWKVGGASDETLRSVSTPTGLSLHGVVRHLENIERYWFREIFAGERGLRYDWTDEDGDAEFRFRRTFEWTRCSRPTRRKRRDATP